MLTVWPLRGIVRGGPWDSNRTTPLLFLHSSAPVGSSVLQTEDVKIKAARVLSRQQTLGPSGEDGKGTVVAEAILDTGR